jgi:N-glycosylase/DNA lyase
MNRSPVTYDRLDDLRREYEEKGEAIRRRLADFAAVSPRDYFYELVYCLLTPQSSAVSAAKAVSSLRSRNLLGTGINPAGVLQHKTHYIRFHNTKAKRLLEARAQFPRIATALNNGLSSQQLREWLVENVKGLGWKEASHFLRNIGHRNLAILDRHILRNLEIHRVLRALPQTLTRKRYLAIEQTYAAFAKKIGIPMDELDLLFWSRETGQLLK